MAAFKKKKRKEETEKEEMRGEFKILEAQRVPIHSGQEAQSVCVVTGVGRDRKFSFLSGCA